jgi:hypothetical protein
MTWTTLVFVFTLCYTGLRAELGNPCAQVMAKVNEPRQNQKTKSYQQKKLALYHLAADNSIKQEKRPHDLQK